MAAALVVMQANVLPRVSGFRKEEIATLLFAALISAVLDMSLSQPYPMGLRLPAKPSNGRLALFYDLPTISYACNRYGIAMGSLLVPASPTFDRNWCTRLHCVPCRSPLWYGPLTHSTANMSQFVVAVKDESVRLVAESGRKPAVDVSPGRAQQELTPAQYQKQISEYYKKDEKFVTSLPDASEPKYALQARRQSDASGHVDSGFNY